MLAAVTLVGGGAGNIGAGTKAKSELGFFLCSMAVVTPIKTEFGFQVGYSKIPEGHV